MCSGFGVRQEDHSSASQIVCKLLEGVKVATLDSYWLESPQLKKRVGCVWRSSHTWCLKCQGGHRALLNRSCLVTCSSSICICVAALPAGQPADLHGACASASLAPASHLHRVIVTSGTCRFEPLSFSTCWQVYAKASQR
jgi:hypothetical protein